MLIFIFFATLSLSYAPKREFQSEYLTPLHLKHYSFGFADVIADLLWIRALQDIDYCNKQISENVCINGSWLFLILNQVTELSPNFSIVYRTGGVALSVILTDVEGATALFKKGYERFPKDWVLLYRAAYHALYEEKNETKAADLLKRAADNGAPKWAYSLAGGLYAKTGQLHLGESLLAEMKANNEDPVIIKRLEDKLAKFKAEQNQNKK